MSAEGYYHHSGKITLPGIAGGLLTGGILAFLLAWPYSYFILYVPIVYISFLAAIGYGMVTGALATKAIKAGKTRSNPAAAAVGIAVGLVALYSSWAVWIHGLVARIGRDISAVELMRDPSGMWDAIRAINSIGAWKLRGSTPTGAVLWTVWGVEAAIIVGGAAFGAWSLMESDPYCESCNTWCKEKPKVCTVTASTGSPEFKQRMEAKDFSVLEQMGAPSALDSSFRLSIHQCPTCRMFNTLTVNHDAVTVDKKSRKSVNSKSLVNKLLLGAGEAEKIEASGAKLAAAAAAAAASA